MLQKEKIKTLIINCKKCRKSGNVRNRGNNRNRRKTNLKMLSSNQKNGFKYDLTTIVFSIIL